jgi:hypothetical protein
MSISAYHWSLTWVTQNLQVLRHVHKCPPRVPLSHMKPVQIRSACIFYIHFSVIPPLLRIHSVICHWHYILHIQAPSISKLLQKFSPVCVWVSCSFFCSGLANKILYVYLLLPVLIMQFSSDCSYFFCLGSKDIFYLAPFFLSPAESVILSLVKTPSFTLIQISRWSYRFLYFDLYVCTHSCVH